MKTKVAILGSTGSIGQHLLEIIKKDKKNFQILFLSADKNHKLLIKQAKLFNVKNIIITNYKSYLKLKKNNKIKHIKIFNNFNDFDKIIKKKIDYVMSAIVGINGLLPTLNIIKYTKTIAIANKESLICGWKFIKKELEKCNTLFIPIDSEHFSIWYSLDDKNHHNIEKIFLTASGGPFLKLPLNNFKNIKFNQALNHPNWSMGKKISVDSATMMNKVFEIIEAKNIFNLKYSNLSILVHEDSYAHAIIKFKDGITKIVLHDTNMTIPIFNSIYFGSNKILSTNKIDIKKLNTLNFQKIDIKKFPITKILKKMPEKFSLFETIVVSLNDTLVSLFLNKKISFDSISKLFLKFIKDKEFNKYKQIEPNKVEDITSLHNYVRIKIESIKI